MSTEATPAFQWLCADKGAVQSGKSPSVNPQMKNREESLISEQKFQGKLQRAGLPCRGSDPPERRGSQSCTRITPIGMVEDIKEFATELEIHVFTYSEILGK